LDRRVGRTAASLVCRRLALPGDAGETAAVPEQQRIARLGIRPLHVLHVHLLDLEVAVGVDLDLIGAEPAVNTTSLVGKPESETGRPATWKLPISATVRLSATATVEASTAAIPSTNATMRCVPPLNLWSGVRPWDRVAPPGGRPPARRCAPTTRAGDAMSRWTEPQRRRRVQSGDAIPTRRESPWRA